MLTIAMLSLSGYRVEEELHIGRRTVIARALDHAGQRVVLKTTRSMRPAPRDVARLEAEYRIGRRVEHDNVVRYLSLESSAGRPIIVLEDFGGRALGEVLGGRPVDLASFLSLALQLARGLAALHAQRIVHKDINPSNLFYDAASGVIRIGDLGIATLLDDETQQLTGSTGTLEGTLHYIAPEQTGRINRSVDYRSDYYSLGATFYELLCGRPPFTSSDPLELVHAHLARLPPAPREVSAEIPSAVSALVMKLMAKSANERYQSDEALVSDLERCAVQLRQQQAIEDFPLAADDVRARLRIPERLYGRQRALDILLRALDRAVDGSRQLLLISGPPGIGKSSLVGELQPHVARRRGWFVSGKFEQIRRDEPHSAFVQAVGQLVREILMLSSDRLQRWRDRLQQLLGDGAGALLERLPWIRPLIGEHPQSTELPPVEAEQRFARLLGRFLRAFAATEHPLVLFLDDLQWADRASLRLLERLLADERFEHLLVVASCRSDGLAEADSLRLTLEAIADGPARLRSIELGPLEQPHVAQMIAETLDVPIGEAEPLAELLYRKTLGNPLFLKQFLRSLYREHQLAFDATRRAWSWDLDAIAGAGLADDVVVLLLRRMRRLPQDTRRMLQLAACAGRRFDLGTLSLAADRSVAEVVAALGPAFGDGIIRAIDAEIEPLVSGCGVSVEEARQLHCDFVHDRFRQAAYESIPESARGALHLRFGRLLRDFLEQQQRDDSLFAAVAHFDAAPELTDPDERLGVVRLYQRAGRKAVAAVAFDLACHMFGRAVELLPEDRWERLYELTTRLYRDYLAALSVELQHVETSLRVGEELLARAREPFDRVGAAAVVVLQLARSGQPERSLQRSTEMLSELGIAIDFDDPAAAVRERYGRLRELIGERPVESLGELPPMRAPMELAKIELLHGSMMAMFMRRRDLVAPATLISAILALEHGNPPSAPLLYASLGRVVAHRLGEIDAGCRFARLGLRISEETGSYRAGTLTLAAGMTLWLREPLHEVVAALEEGFRVGVETRDVLFAGLCASLTPTLSFAAGTELAALERQCHPRRRYIEAHMGRIGMREIDLTMRMIEALRGGRPLDRPIFDSDAEAERELRVTRVTNPEAMVWYHLLSSKAAYLAGDRQRALRCAEEGYRYADRRQGAFAAYDLDFHHGLMVAVQEGAERRLPAVRRKLHLLEKLVDAGARSNFDHKRQLLDAECARLSGDAAAAGRAYERAIVLANEGGFTPDQAIAHERAAQFYASQGLDRVALVYLREARYGYRKWGALAKVAQLDREHPDLAAAEGSGGVVELTPTTESVDEQADLLDLSSAIKASQAISGEVLLESLLGKLLRIIAENAGARRAFLVLAKGDKLQIEAKLEAGPDVERMGSAALERSRDLAVGVVRYAARTRRPLVLRDAAAEGDFRSEPYIARNRIRSLLCAPLVNQNRLSGVIYLENDLTSGAFTPERLELVSMLSAQAAISIDNALLYRRLSDYSRTLEQKVEARTRDLADKNQQLNESLQRQREMQNQLLISEKMASLGNLVAGVAHEINTPVGAVVSSADTMRRALERLEAAIADRGRDDRSGRTAKRMLEVLRDNNQVVANAASRVSEIVGTLRNFARLDEAEFKEADLNEGLDSTLTLARHRLTEHIEVVTRYGELPAVRCYPNQLNQVFMNLLINGIDAIEQRGADVGQPARGTVTIRSWFDGEVHVQVTDDGIGIPPDAIERIFDPGFTTKGVGVGTGLGLSICFNIVEKHGGRIEVDSAPGRGTSFTVSLPTSPPERSD